MLLGLKQKYEILLYYFFLNTFIGLDRLLCLKPPF